MSSVNSKQDTDGTTWATAGLRLGSSGMDLRRPSEPPTLADLVNARFLDERTVIRRTANLGIELRDGADFPTGTLNGSGQWIYGHGCSLGLSPANTHYPVHNHGAGVFKLGDNEVVWTGDRLLVPQTGGAPCLGADVFWRRVADTATTALPYGIPAHLPLMTETPAPAVVHGDWVEGCITASLRVFVRITGSTMAATVVDRATGVVVSDTIIASTSAAPVEPSVLETSEPRMPAILWRDSTDNLLRLVYWTGTGWTNETTFGTGVQAYDVAVTPDGFHVLWSEASSLKVGKFVGQSGQAVPYAFGTTLATGLMTFPLDRVAIAVTPTDEIGIAYNYGLVHFRTYSSAAVPVSPAITVSAYNAQAGVSIVSRYLKGASSAGVYEYVVYAADDSGTVTVTSIDENQIFEGEYVANTSTRYNSDLVSRGFRVGDEVFAWLRSRNSGSLYMLSGARHPYVSGSADRETGVQADGTPHYWQKRVLADPADVRAEGGDFGVVRHWVRKYVTGAAADAGNVIGALMDFLPAITTAIHGRSAYLSGSLVKNWDGRSLLDAGFQDFPVITGTAQATGGSLTLTGKYEYRCYLVRYNDQGERFESAAITSDQITMSGSNDQLTLTIATVPSTSQGDCSIEIYRTEDSGSAFYLEGVVANPLTSATVTFVSTMSDAVLRTKDADPHAPATGLQPELESFAPIGCAILTSIGDRLWGAGGQVPAGRAQFSKLKTNGFGAGFDDVAGYLQVDNENNAITSIAGLNDARVIFERDRIYVVGGNGPDNEGNGAFSVPQLVLAAGATSHFGTLLCQLGVLYWGAPGPLLLTHGFSVENVSSAMRPRTELQSPTGSVIDVSRMEAVWYTGSEAVLMNYMTGEPRWARWTLGAHDVVGTESGGLAVTAVGRVLSESDDGAGDDGVPFPFTLRSGNVRAEALLEGHSLIRRVGVLGSYAGPHNLRLRAYFDESPLWSEESVWSPVTDTWLETVEDNAALTPAQIDQQQNVDKSGEYASHKRMRRQTCHYVGVEVSDISAWAPTYTPYELAFELGSKPGLGRTPSNAYSGQDR